MDAQDGSAEDERSARDREPRFPPASPGERPLAICLFTDSRAPSGVGEHMLTLVRHLRAACRLSVVGMRSAESRRLLRRAEALGCDTLAMPRWELPESLAELGRFLAAQRPDIMHIHAGVGWEGLPAAYAARSAGVPAIIRTEHLPYLLTDERQRRWHAENLPLLQALVCVSDSSRRSYEAEGAPPSLLHVIRNGVDPSPPTASRDETRRRLGVPGGVPLLLTVARLAAQKGHADLLAAAPLVLAACPDARFAWVGAGPLESALAADVEAAGLSHAILRLGRRDDVPDLMAASDLLVLPSLFEGLPLVLLEAMAAGLPALATRVPGSADAVRDGESGVLVPPGDPPALAAAIIALLRDPARRAALASSARRRFEADFTAARMARETLALYRRLLSVARADARLAPTPSSMETS
ncbi:glycosyltransferase [Alsobacter sp. KACC 23698]|uniref:Glycosyltransferase n=2 Tax=Alsobacter sp. KACC 23698 TaxID=3149229 RepID=A0AAU7JJT8_9HYPH